MAKYINNRLRVINNMIYGGTILTDIDIDYEVSMLLEDTEFYYTPSQNREINLLAGASCLGTIVEVRHIGTSNTVDVVYSANGKAVLSPKKFIRLKWVGIGWTIIDYNVYQHGFLPRTQCPISGVKDFVRFSTQPYLFSNTVDKLILAIANGVDANGQKNIIIEYSDNVTPPEWSNAIAGEYLYLEYDDTNNSVSYGKTSSKLVESYDYPSAPSEGMYFYHITNRRGYIYTGNSWTKKLRLYLGYMSSSSTIISYAINAEYEHVFTSIASRTAYNVINQLFTANNIEVTLNANIITAINDYVVGDNIIILTQPGGIYISTSNAYGAYVSISSGNVTLAVSRDIYVTKKLDAWTGFLLPLANCKFTLRIKRSYD